MSLGSRILDVFLVQAFDLVTFGSLGTVQGSREGMELTWAEACSIPGNL